MRHTERVDSEEVQGPGSFIVLRTMSRGETKRLSEINADPERKASGEYERVLAEIAATCIVEWNWTGPDGEILQVVPDTIGVMLSDQEFWFLHRAMFQVSFPSEAEKNA